MDKLFDQNNVFYRLMSLLYDLVVLNVLTIVFCIPIFTAGSALTALHHCLWRIVRDEDEPLVRMYVKAFKDNFRQVTPVWLVVLAIAGVGVADFYFIVHIAQIAPTMTSIRLPLLAVLAIVTTIVVSVTQYYMIFVSRYDNTNRNHLKNAALSAMGFFPYTVAMLAILAGTVIAAASFYLVSAGFIMLLGLSLPQYCCALLYVKIFGRLDGGVDAKNSAKDAAKN